MACSSAICIFKNSLFRFISHTFSFRLPLVFSLAAYFASDGVISAYFLLTCYLFTCSLMRCMFSFHCLKSLSSFISFPIPFLLGSISVLRFFFQIKNECTRHTLVTLGRAAFASNVSFSRVLRVLRVRFLDSSTLLLRLNCAEII